MRSLFPLTIISVLILLPLIGCGSSDRPDLGEVSGTVTLDGKPLPKADVIFQHEKKRYSRGITDENGQYSLIYTRDVTGAAVGNHRVVILAKDANKRQIVPLKYNANTTLTAEVKPGQNTFDFALTTTTDRR